MIQIPSPRSEKKARIEIIPLIDIVFFLLATFVMVSMSMIKNKAVPVNLPVASTAAPQEEKPHFSLSITQDGQIYLDGEGLSLEQLPQRLASLKAATPEMRIIIHGDENARLGVALSALDTIRAQGISRVAFQTREATPK